ncbi:MAG: hypothetical protein JHD02_03275 [Thermoleophilaceae bacterium]|nr:hypothetical protein [Thermoleophilaceae bacterium]
MIGRAAATARSEIAGPSIRSAWMRAGLLAIAVTALVLILSPGVPKASGTPFAPTISIETSTTRASAHPDARITIDNTASDENIASMTMSLPDSFWGSLGAVEAKCTTADLYDLIPHCPANTKVGTVTASAKIEDVDTGTMVNGVLSGDIFLTEDLAGTDPAGVAIIVDAKVDGVDLGKVVATGRAVMRTAIPDGWDPEASPQIRGLDTIVDTIPSSVYDAANNRTVNFKVETMQIDLLSELQDASQPGYRPPLLTNPSKCDTYELKTTMTSLDTATVATPSDTYTVDGCDTVRFDPEVTSTFSGGASVGAGSSQGMVTNVEFPTASGQPNANGSIQRMKLRLPRGIGANLTSFGSADDRCSGASMNEDTSDPANPIAYFMPSQCTNSMPIGDFTNAMVGTATVHTPLLPDSEPLHGVVYSVNKTPIPGLAILITEDMAGNPKGINTSIAGLPDTKQFDSNCGSSCGSGIVMNFAALPDVPVSSIEIDLNRPDRAAPTDGNPGRTLSSKLLSQASAGDTDCQKDDDFAFDAYTPSSPSSSFPSVTTIPTSGCTSTQKFTPTTGPWGQTSTNASPTYTFTYAGATANLLCGIDLFKAQSVGCPAGSSPTGTTGSITGSSLTTGTHVVYANPGVDTTVSGGGLTRFTGIRPVRSYDDTVPTTTLTAGPGFSGGIGTTASSRPSFTFNASETSTFQCSLDDGAFLPCGSATGTASAAAYQLPTADSLEASDVVHTFEVRAQDSAGNVDLTPVSASFKVEKTFDPQVTVALTTTVGRAHPEMTVTVTNDSHEDIKDLNLNMPDGFFGGLTGVQSLCSLADASAGTCGSGSQVGTVETTALIDRSTAYISGKVFLTEPQPGNFGDPAGLTILVKPKLQDVTFNPIKLNARLMVRGEGEGVNTATLDIPNTATTTLNEVSSFDLRTMVLKLKNNNAAPKPLLTNPSSCGTKTFPVTMTGRNATVATEAPTAVFTGCESLSFQPNLGISQVERSTGGPPGPSDNITRATIDMTASMTADPNGAGIKSVALTMPEPVTIDVQRIPPPCQQAQADAKACPASSAVGTVSAVSPLLPEPLTGTVYILKSATSLPRLLIALRGRINVDLIANNSYTGPKFNKILAELTMLPDVPLSSFNMNINGFLTTRADSCDTGPEDWFATSVMSAHNGSASTTSIPLSFKCPNATNSIYESSWKPKGAKSTLKLDVSPQGSRQLKKVTVKLPKGVKFVKSAFSKKNVGKRVSVVADGKKLKAKCFKLKNSTTFEIGFCKQLVGQVTISFKSGSITTGSKSKKLKLKVKTVDSANKTQTSKLVK